MRPRVRWRCERAARRARTCTCTASVRVAGVDEMRCTHSEPSSIVRVCGGTTKSSSSSTSGVAEAALTRVTSCLRALITTGCANFKIDGIVAEAKRTAAERGARK